MHTLGTHFEELLKNIRPPQERLDAARDLPPKVRQYLKKHETFETLAPHSRLAGSYAQDTCVGDVKDVDFLIRVDGDPEQNEPEAKQLIRDLKKALDDLPEALGYEGLADIDIEGARRSVHVYFRNHDFHLDVVPCMAPDGFEDVLYVPDKGFNRWIASAPIGYINLLKELNDKHRERVRPLIKIFKHFRNYQMKTRRPKSYWLGALVIHQLNNGNIDTTKSIGEIFRDLLDGIYLQYDHLLFTSDTATPNIPDPILGHNISWNWSRSHFETFMRRVDEARKRANKALESNDKATAVSLWRQIFGEEFFPTEIDEAALRFASLALPGQAYTLPSGVITVTRPDSGIYTPIPDTTFYGKS